MPEQLPFRKGDIVRLIKTTDFYSGLPEVGTEHVIKNVHAPSQGYPTGLYGPVACYNIEPEYFELVYRPATREETESLRKENAELKQAIDRMDALEARNKELGAQVTALQQIVPVSVGGVPKGWLNR